MIDLSPEQQRAYDRYITARNKMGIGCRVKPRKWIPSRDYLACVDIAGMNHPLFVVNDDWVEYKEAFLAWLAVEPRFREEERLRMSRGDYGIEDSWDERSRMVTDSFSKLKDGE
jgi:hypothetical protein